MSGSGRVALLASLVLGVATILACGHRAGSSESTTSLELSITDQATGKPVAARVLLLDAHGEPLHLGTLDLYGQRQGQGAVWLDSGVLGTWDGLIVAQGYGRVAIGKQVPYGRYHVWAWRGIEYERWEGDVDLSEQRGKVALAIALERAWAPQVALAADLHVHAFASNDSTLPNPQRVIAQAAAGIQVIGLSDHNANGDLGDDIAALGMTDRVVSIASNELTSDVIHLGVYPVPVDRKAPRGGAPVVPPASDIAQMFAFAHGFANHPIVQVNHPRFRFGALFDAAHWNGVSWPPPFPLDFDAVEVLAGYSAFNVDGDRRFDDSARDLFTLFDHGHLVAPLGNSDTHDLNWVLDGTTRSYVFADDPRVQPFDEDGFIRAIRARRVVATSGPWLDVEVATEHGATPTVGPGGVLAAKNGAVWLDVTLAQTHWVHVDRIRVTIGGPDGPRVAQTVDVPANVRTHRWSGAIQVGDRDTWLAVTADGDQALPLALTGSYQRDKWHRAGVTPFAIASPILIDADGDGRWKRGDADLPAR